MPRDRWADVVGAAALDLPAQQAELIESWAARGWPAIVRRRGDDDGAGLPIAVPLPPRFGKARIALRLDARVPVERRAPVLLCDAVTDAPDAWQASIQTILSLGRSIEAEPRVFGALLWQHLTGLAYLHAGSDLDLLWSWPADCLHRLLDGLRAIDGRGAVRIDGEIELGGGAAVAWRELDNARGDPAAEVLVKSMEGVSLRRAATILNAPPC